MDAFVQWFRLVTPYIHAYQNKVFVMSLGGRALSLPHLKNITFDINVLLALGIRVVLVHGAREQIEDLLKARNLPSRFHNGYRVTAADTLECVLNAVGSVHIEISAMLSQGLPNTPMANAKNRVIGGNFITAQPIGVLEGVDLQYTGKVRKVDADGILAQLKLGNLVLINTEGLSPTGEIFNLEMADVAQAVSVALRADKLIFLTEGRGIFDEKGEFLDALTSDELSALPLSQTPDDVARFAPHAAAACRAGVGRVHFVPWQTEGALLKELFTHDGVGSVITRESLENMREAKSDDIAALIAIIEPLEAAGVLVPRPRELLEREIEHFSIMLHDNIVVGCAALYVQEKTEDEPKMAELACLAVRADQREWGYGESLLRRIESRARAQKIEVLFVLTTQTEHWFMERGFALGEVSDLPQCKRRIYNLQRKSKVLFKKL